MLPVGFKAIVTRLDAGTLTELMRGLLQAEANALGMSANTVVVSEALTDADGGLDARIDDVPQASQTIPPGLVGFQFKAYKAKTISNAAIEKELTKPGPTRVLQNGGSYVLVWQADLNDQQRSNAESKLKEEAAELVVDPKSQVWDASTIVALAEIYPAVVAAMELVEFGAVRGLPELEETLKVQERPYEADDDRASAIEQIRTRVGEESEDAIIVTLSGLAGTGKTRLVAEALSSEDVRDRVLYADSAEGLQTFIGRVVRDDRTTGVLVVDELDERDRDSIHSRFAATRGRWRLLAIVPQTTGRLRPSGSRDIPLVPLEEDAMRRLIEATSGLTEVKARMVAEVAKGFPELAFRLAEELQHNPDLDLVRLAHLDRPHDVLERALPDQRLRDALKPLALFTGLGVEGDLEYQLDEVASAFSRDPAAMKQVIALELSRHRFVSAAGRYRIVSPTLVAIWLAVELIDETPELDKLIAGLSIPVQEAFFRQLELFGPETGQLGPALERLLNEPRFRDPGSFDEAAGRFLRASAAVVPPQVAGAIDELLNRATDEQLRALPRRGLVWALQILLWWPETWDLAVENLRRLALHETERFSNNATGGFRDAFGVYLSGSTVTYSHRIGWLASAVSQASEGELSLLAKAAAQGLERHHHRMVVGFRGGGEPEDWQPGTVGELREARRGAWTQLLAVLDKSAGEERLEVVQAVGRGILTMVFDGLLDQVDTDLRSRDWHSVERAELLGDIQRLIRAGGLPEPALPGVVALRTWLLGSSTEDRLRTTLATPIWELHDDLKNVPEDPPALVELADEVAAAENGANRAVTTGRETANEGTRFRFLALVARRLGSEALADAADTGPPLDGVVFAAAMSVADERGEGAWVDQTLASLATGVYAEHVPVLASYANVTESRLAIALDLIEDARASAIPLGNLRGGARFLALPLEFVERILRALASAGALENALGMLLQFVEAPREGQVPQWARALGLELSKAALLSESGDVMFEYYVKEFVARGLFDPANLADLWDLRMRSRHGLVEELDQVLTQTTLADAPTETLERIIRLIRDEASGDASFSLFASRDLALLSEVAQHVGVDDVWAALEPLSEHELRIAIHHMRWSGNQPDPLVERFLSSSRLDGYETEAFTTFYNTLGVVSGDYWRGLARELERARSWRNALKAPSAQAWAGGLVQRYEHDIESQRRRDEEENFRLGG